MRGRLQKMNIVRSLKNIINKITNKKSELEILSERGLKYGKNFNMYNCEIDSGHCFLIEIGDDVTMTHSTILAHDATTKLDLGKTKVGKVKIGSRVFIGYGSLILCNVTIGDDVIVGAGSVVTKDIPSDSIVAGNPAKIIGKRSIYIEKHRENMQKSPVYNTFWANKTNEEKNRMILELDNNQLGYDE